MPLKKGGSKKGIGIFTIEKEPKKRGIRGFGKLPPGLEGTKSRAVPLLPPSGPGSFYQPGKGKPVPLPKKPRVPAPERKPPLEKELERERARKEALGREAQVAWERARLEEQTKKKRKK